MSDSRKPVVAVEGSSAASISFRNGDTQDGSYLYQASGRDPVVAFLVFLDLLKRHT
jgi:hypothetical protein